MKRIVTWIYGIAIALLVTDWGIMGLKIFDNDYNITVEAYIGVVCIAVILICSMYRIFSNRCRHCGKVRWTNGDYCSYCGKRHS